MFYFSVKRIPLRNRQKKIARYAIVDDEDYDFLRQWKWYAHKCRSRNRVAWYAQRHEKGKLILMHRLLLNLKKGEIGDHKDRNGLNNRRGNLRKCTRNQNSMNLVSRRGASKYKGLTWLKERKKWHVKITNYRKRIFLGNYANEKDAARAYDAAARVLFGEFARLNFP